MNFKDSQRLFNGINFEFQKLKSSFKNQRFYCIWISRDSNGFQRFFNGYSTVIQRNEFWISRVEFLALKINGFQLFFNCFQGFFKTVLTVSNGFSTVFNGYLRVHQTLIGFARLLWNFHIHDTFFNFAVVNMSQQVWFCWVNLLFNVGMRCC